MQPLDTAFLPPGIRARFVRDVNGLDMHILETGFAPAGRPLILLLHGFPELAYSWRKVMPALADAGFHAVAPDQRGYGRTSGWSPDYDADLRPFRLLNAVRDALGLVAALGHRSVASVIGHDFGASVAAWCALARPDIFRSLALMSAPFAGPPDLPFATDGKPPQVPPSPSIHEALAALERPRKHYQWYYSTRPANAQMWHCQQGVHDFLRAYFHHKSADWPGNRPHRLQAWSAGELAKMPTYYIMDLADDMPATVAKEMPSAAEIAACRWLPDSELAVYAAEYRAASTGTARAAAAPMRASCSCSPAAPSTCRRSSFPARAIGASTSGRGRSSECGKAPAPAWSASTCSTAPGIGCSRNSPRRSSGCWSISCGNLQLLLTYRAAVAARLGVSSAEITHRRSTCPLSAALPLSLPPMSPVIRG